MTKPNEPRAWFLVLPVVVMVAFSAVIPLMTVVNYSVQDILGPDQRVFVANEWYHKVLNDPELHGALLRQLLYSAVVLVLELPLGVGVALCFRGNVANMGAEGQIAIGGLAASFVALIGAGTLGAAVLPAALLGGILGGAAWAGIAAAINLTRGVHEVLVTLMMNFIAWLIVAEFLHGPLGEIDAGFPQTPMFENVAWTLRTSARSSGDSRTTSRCSEMRATR